MALLASGTWTFWIVGGALALGLGGVLFLFGAAGLAMWGNARDLARHQAREEAAFHALTPAQKLALASTALGQAGGAARCLALLTQVPEGTPGRAEALAEATARQEAEDRARRAMEAQTPAEHLAAARAALDQGQFAECRGHLFYVPRDYPGCEALMADLRNKESAATAVPGR